MSDFLDAKPAQAPGHPSRLDVPRDGRLPEVASGRFGGVIGYESQDRVARGTHIREGRVDRAGERPIERPLRCLLTTLNPESALSRALVQHLTAEMPGIQFGMHSPAGGPDADALWVCGYRPGHGTLVRRLRQRFPEAAIIVTGRAPIDAWESEVLRAGADSVCTWPLPYGQLAVILKQKGRRSVG
ncbi:MAG: hypothetical protein ACI8PQ_000564 [Planctomycetota bacterium]|jgi:hypothetical protein